MDGKDWLLVLAAIVIFGGPVGHAIWKRSRGDVQRMPRGETFVTDPIRIGETIAQTGGRALAEGAKLLKYGSLRYTGDSAQTGQQLVGGA